jgi:hypothetical protein
VWTGNLPVRAGRALELAGYDVRSFGAAGRVAAARSVLGDSRDQLQAELVDDSPWACTRSP